jgi:hypothetical protein
MRRFKNNYTQRKQLEEITAVDSAWSGLGLGCLMRGLVEIARALRTYPWIVEVVRQRPVSIPHPYMAEVYVAVDGSEACISLSQSKAYCGQNGAAREVKLELEFKRYEVYEEEIGEVYRPKGLLAYTTAAREYVRIL